MKNEESDQLAQICLSYKPFKWNSIIFEMNIIAIRKELLARLLSMTYVWVKI